MDSSKPWHLENRYTNHNKERLKIAYDPRKTTWTSIFELLSVAKEAGKEGPIAQYLVGAKLQLRFPNEKIGNESYSTADAQLNRSGDFLVGNTAFHVTVSPMPAVYEKCKSNLSDGLRVYLLVPNRVLEGARQNASTVSEGCISVESVESFVAQNIDELSTFSKKKVTKEFHHLLTVYNDRVDKTEIDKSMLIEIPKSLQSA